MTCRVVHHEITGGYSLAFPNWQYSSLRGKPHPVRYATREEAEERARQFNSGEHLKCLETHIKQEDL